MKALAKQKLFIASMAMAFASGCGSGSTSFSLLSDSDQFQSAGVSDPRIDVLWVVDNSQSMESVQTSVATNFQVFIEDFQTKGFDFNMAVLATDTYKSLFGGTNCTAFRTGIRNNSGCGTYGWATYSGIPILTNLTSNISGNFMLNSILTQETPYLGFGSGDERAFLSIQVGLDAPVNSGFLRPGSSLAVIMVGDEDDVSHSDPGGKVPTDPTLHNPQIYVDYLDTKTGSTPTNRNYKVHALAIPDNICRAALEASSGWVLTVGNRLRQLADLTGGIKASLCDNFADSLKDISADILTNATPFKLSRIPIPETISVNVNGVPIPPKATNPLNNGGWEYSATQNAIYFYGSLYLPPAGAVISVNYDPVAYGS
jgi:hypothetical protein